jgi:hypothetical protein
MAKTQLGILVEDIRGKAGNTVFTKTKDGIVVKPRVTPANPDTPAQRQVRENLSKAATTWRNFTASQVQAWKNYAQHQLRTNPVNSRKRKQNPMNAFVELAAKFLQVDPSGTIPTTPPTAGYSGDTIAITATAGTGKVTFEASAANSANTTTELLLQPLAGPNRTPQKNAYRSKGFFQFESGSLEHDIEVPPGYYAAAYRFVNKQTGQATKLTYLPVQGVTLAIEQGGKSTSKKAA